VRFVDEAARRAFREAVTAIEKESSVEVVIAIRARLRRWPSANAAVGLVLAIAMLAFTLYADTVFELWEILVLPWLAALLGGLLVELIPALARMLTPRRIRTRELRDAARATFYELGVLRTRHRTGVLVFVAIRARAVALVGDVAVVDKLGQPRLDGIAARLAAAIPRGAPAVARALQDAGQVFAEALPRDPDDIDELVNEVHVVRPRGRSRAVAS